MSEYARLVIAADSTQVRQAERDLTALERQSSATESSAVKMAARIGAAYGTLKLGSHISEVVQLASRYDQMGLVMETVGRNTGRSTVELAALDQALQDTGISALQSRNNIIKMMSANIDLTQATKLARLAQDAAVIGNLNSSEAFERLIKGIQSAEKETLETMGLNVNFAQSYEKLAAQLGKNADSLTTVEKVQAATTAALEAGVNIAGAYDASMENVGKQLGSTARHLENLQIALGSAGQGEFGAVVDAYSTSLKFLGENADTVAQILKTTLYAGATVATVAVTKKTHATVSAALATRAQAADELRLAQAQAASTGATRAKLQATFQATGATTGLTAAISAHEAAERRLATAQAASVGIGRGLLGVMGGPVGLAITAGAVALSFMDWGHGAEEAARKSIALRAETELLTRAVQELDAAQAQQVLQRMEGPYKAAQDEARKYAAQVEYLNMQIDRHPGSAKVDEWNRSLVDAKGNLSTVNQEIDKQEQKMRDLNARIEENTKAREQNSEVANETDVAGQKWLASLQRQADFAGKLTEVQRASIAIEKGYAGTLSETDKALALKNAALIDQSNALKTVTKSTSDSTSAYKTLRDSLFPAEAAQRKYNEQVALLQKHLSGDRLAKAIDRLNDSLADGDHTGPADAIEAYRKELERLEDKINPAGRAAREFAEEQAFLRKEIERTGDPLGKYTALLVELEKQYEENSRVTSQWTEWTESSLERVDSAFADAWRNIGDGFSSFRDSLTNAFKQMLAELAHLAITRRIVMQIGAAIGVGGASTSAMAGAGGSGGGLLSMAQQGYGMYQAATGQGLIGSVVSGYQAGGLSGAWGGATGWGSGIGAGLNAGAGQLYGMATQGGAGLTTYAPLTYQMGGLGNTVTAAAPWMAGIGGAYMGYQQGGWGGAGLGGLGGWGGATAGAAGGAALSSILGVGGSVLGPLGAIAGGILGSTLGSMLGGSLFGGSGERFKTTVGSATGYYGDEGYVSTGPDASYYPGKRQFGDEHDAALDGLNDAFTSMLGGLFDVFDVDSTVSSTIRTRLRRTSGRMVGDLFVEIDGEITKFYGQYSKDGKLGEAMEQFADDVLGKRLAESIVNSALPEHLRKQFEGLTEAEEVAETLAGVIGRFEGVNAVLDTVNLTLLETTNAGLIAGDTIIALAGGLEALQANTSVYYDRFFSEQEKIEDTLESVTRAFETADITLAGSREAYRAMVEDIDVTTEAGQSMFATMMALAGQADQYYSILEQTGNALIQTAGAMFGAAMGEAGAAFSALQRSITNEQQKAQAAHNARLGSLNDMLATTSSRIGDMGRISSMLDAALKRLRGTSDDATRSLRAQAVMTLNSALVTARSGQSLEGIDGLQEALDIAAQMDTALYSSLVDFKREQGRTANLISELEKVNGKQLTTEEKMLAALEVQISAAQAQYDLEMVGLSAQLEAAQRQIDALNGVDNSIMSLAHALDRMSSAVEAAQVAQAAAAKAAAQRPVENAVDQLYRNILGREADAGGRDYWVSQLDSGTLSLGNIGATIGHSALNNANATAEEQRNASKYLGIPGFASGGMHSGGWRIVGEQGPELELTGPSRIYSAGQTAAMLQGGDNAATVSELRQLRDTFHSGMRQLAKFMEQTATSTRQMNQSGVQIVGTVDTREVAV